MMALVALGGKSPSEVAECLLDQHYLAVTKGKFKELQAFDEPRALFEELVASILPASVERNMPFLSGKESLTGGFVQAAMRAYPELRCACAASLQDNIAFDRTLRGADFVQILQLPRRGSHRSRACRWWGGVGKTKLFCTRAVWPWRCVCSV